MKVLLLISVLLLAFQSNLKDEIKLKTGAVLPDKYIKQKVGINGTDIEEMIITAPSQLYPFIEREINNVKYLIAFNSRSREIQYIHTTDKGFRTEEGLKVGDCVHYSENQLQRIIGWEIRAPQTKEAWYPVVGLDLPLSVFNTRNEAKDCSIITGFSKGGN